jgi:phospholipid/cholesterol/gamma-HCH transport system substrate-binding protein
VYRRLDSTLVNLNRLLVGFEQDPGRYLRQLRLVDVF